MIEYIARKTKCHLRTGDIPRDVILTALLNCFILQYCIEKQKFIKLAKVCS